VALSQTEAYQHMSVENFALPMFSVVTSTYVQRLKSGLNVPFVLLSKPILLETTWGIYTLHGVLKEATL